MAAMDNDFATSEAQAVLFDLAHEINRNRKDKAEVAAQLAGELKFLGSLLGLLERDAEEYFQAGDSAGIDATEVEALIQRRAEAKASRDFAEADQIRNELLEKGILLEDGPNGTSWRRS